MYNISSMLSSNPFQFIIWNAFCVFGSGSRPVEGFLDIQWSCFDKKPIFCLLWMCQRYIPFPCVLESRHRIKKEKKKEEKVILSNKSHDKREKDKREIDKKEIDKEEMK